MTVIIEGGITQACGKLHLTRTPVIKAIMDLEQALGTRLFTRKQSGMVANTQGLHLYHQILPWYLELKKIETSLKAIPDYQIVNVVYDRDIPAILIDYINELLMANDIKFRPLIKDNVVIDNDCSSAEITLTLNKDFTQEKCLKSYDYNYLLLTASREKKLAPVVNVLTIDACNLNISEIARLLPVTCTAPVKVQSGDIMKAAVSVAGGHAVIVVPEPLFKLYPLQLANEQQKLSQPCFQLKLYCTSSCSRIRQAADVIHEALGHFQ